MSMPSAVNSKDIEDLINNLKSGIGLWEDLIAKSSKFSNSIKGMTMACSDLLDSMHTVCDIASKSNCGLRNTGISLTKLVMREKKVEMKVCGVSNALSENLVGELDKCVNEWRRSSIAMKKEREHEWRRANSEYQKSLMEVDRTEKKLRKKNSGKVGLSETASLQIEYANQDAQNKRRYVEELERCAMRRAAIEERQRFKQFLALLKPILDCQLSLREDLDNLEEVVYQLYGDKAENLDVLPEELEQYIQEHMVRSGSRSSISHSFSTLSKQQPQSGGGGVSSISNGSRTSLNSASMSTSSSEWSSNNVLISACMEVSSRLTENCSNISHDSGIRSDRSFGPPFDTTASEHEWDRTLTHSNTETTSNEKLARDRDSDDDASSSSSTASETEGDNDNDVSTDHNSQDGLIDRPDRSAEEPHEFELPLPPPPPHGLYPNQSIPEPTVYSNLQELKLSAARKFGTEAVSTSFTTTETQRPLPSSQTWGQVEFKDQQTVAAPPPIYGNCHEEAPPPPPSTFGNYADSMSQVTGQHNPTMKGDCQMKSSMMRRGSFATEMQVPQTPKTTNTLRRPSVQERAPLTIYSNKHRGRSVSVTRELSVEQEEQNTSSEDFNTIRQRIASRINSEMKSPPPILPKPDAQTRKQSSPNANYSSMSPYDYCHGVSSPGASRTNRFFRQPPSQGSTTSAHNKYPQSRLPLGSQGQDHMSDCAAGEGPASGDFELSSVDLHSMTVTRKEDRFKQQLMQVLTAPKAPSNDSGTQGAPSVSSFYNAAPTGLRASATLATKPKNKSAIPNSKYIY